MVHKRNCNCAACRPYAASEFNKLLSMTATQPIALRTLAEAAQGIEGRVARVAAMAAKANVSYRAIYRWAKTYPAVADIIAQ